MNRMHGRSLRRSALLGVAIILMLGATAFAGESVRTQATLKAPEGAANQSAKGKAKTQTVADGDKLRESLTVMAQKLERNTEYRVVVDGVDAGTVRSKG